MIHNTDKTRTLSLTLWVRPDDDPDLSWLETGDEQDAERLAAFDTGEWRSVGVGVTAIIRNESTGVSQHLQSSGLWGVESDSNDDYLVSIWKDELMSIQDGLSDLGFGLAQVEELRKTTPASWQC